MARAARAILGPRGRTLLPIVSSTPLPACNAVELLVAGVPSVTFRLAVSIRRLSAQGRSDRGEAYEEARRRYGDRSRRVEGRGRKLDFQC